MKGVPLFAPHRKALWKRLSEFSTRFPLSLTAKVGRIQPFRINTICGIQGNMFTPRFFGEGLYAFRVLDYEAETLLIPTVGP